MEKKGTRDAFGEVLCELGRENDKIFVIDADISASTKTTKFYELFPDRAFDIGIAEQNAAGIAAGLATTGKIPFISTYAVFGSMRMLEQIRTSICYPNLNAKIAVSHGGLTPGNDGPTHQAIEDFGIMRSIPNMTVIMPGDYYAVKKLVRKAAEMYGPVYLRFTRDSIPVIYTPEDEFEIGKGKRIKEGNDISIIAIGDMVYAALQAAEKLNEMGISAEVIDMHTLKPLDADIVKEAIDKTGKIITVEDHNIINGLGSAISEVVAETGKGIVRRVGINDTFAESGEYTLLLEKYGLDSNNIVIKAKEILRL
ncbi:MAG: transketolase C-terminal domain-containing protein [Clostridiaceae bacterium]|nr:transketolase C-terminal domain-containing protein [Clostridiaceae bacterium]